MSEKMNVNEIKDWLKSHNLDIKGKKAELYNRMIEHKKKELVDISDSEEEVKLPTIIEEEVPVEKEKPVEKVGINPSMRMRRPQGKLLKMVKNKKIVDFDDK